ncbi:restriction endonuclease [Solilutibacter oculi]|nr:restriction endonuclease [Lysobacter oculi]
MRGLKNVSHRHDDALSRTHWASVEALLAVWYRGQGWAVDHCGTGANGQEFDGGIDLKLRRADEYVLVQCKHWNTKKVPHNDVHQLLGVMVNEGATGAILVTSGEFTEAAKEAASKLGHVQLVDGQMLREMVGPLPEPETAGAANEAPGDLTFRARPTPVVRQHRPRPAYGWLVFSVIALVVFGFIIRALLIRTAGTAGPAPITVSSGEASSQSDDETPVAYVSPSDEQASVDSCKEIIDAPSGTYIDHCASTKPLPPQSAAEIRESQRRAAEAMKVIEASTPEM